MSGCYASVGDVITVPVQMQVAKVYAHEDYIYYLCLPIDNPKRHVTLPGPCAMVSTEYDSDESLPEMPMPMLTKAAEYAQELLKDADDSDDADGPEDGPAEGPTRDEE